MVSQTVLILDSDLGFLFALSQELSRRLIVPVPARTIRQAHSFLAGLHLEPALLVVNCSSSGACRLVEEITDEHRDVRVVAFLSSPHDCSRCAGSLAARLRDPEDRVPDRIPYCADVMQRLIGEQPVFQTGGG